MEEQEDVLLSEDELGAYLRDIRRFPRLTPEEERTLALACAAGDADAQRTMVNRNLRLVVSVAREYAGRGVPLMDLVQEGNIGLMVAARKFDPSLEFRFSTYATKWIRQGITRCLMNHAGLIRVPVHTAEKMRSLMTARAQLLQLGGQEPSPQALAQKIGLSVDRVEKLLQLIPETCSLDAPAGEEGEGTLGQLLPDNESREPQEVIVQGQLLEILDRLVSQLSERQQTILRLHFGMDDGICHSLEDIAGTMGISKERVRQIEKQAFERIRSQGAALGLEDFLED